MKGVREREHTWLTGRLLSCERRWLPGWGTGTNSRCIAPGFYAALQRLERKNLTGVHFVEEILFCLRPMAKGPSIYLILSSSCPCCSGHFINLFCCTKSKQSCLFRSKGHVYSISTLYPNSLGSGGPNGLFHFHENFKKQSCSGPSK